MRLIHRVISCLILLGASVSGDQLPLHRHGSQDGTVSPALFSELEELSRIVDISYCVGATSWGISKPFRCLSRCSDFPDFELVTTWNTGPLLSDSCGYIALDHGKRRVIVAFRGTYSLANTIIDLSTVPQDYVPYPGEDSDTARRDDGGNISLVGHTLVGAAKEPKCLNCTVHMGFHSSWLNTQKHILPELQAQLWARPTYKLNLVGHSLGGAVAALAGLDLLARGHSPTVTTFGEPRVGNTGLANYINERFNLTKNPLADDTLVAFRRITHADDPVPLLPLTEWGYAMHAGEIYISKSSLSPDIADLEHCQGNSDEKCIAKQDSSLNSDALRQRDLITSLRSEIGEMELESWGIPSRYKLWQLLFAHRDYFWRLGLCVPGGDPLGGGGKDVTGHKDL